MQTEEMPSGVQEELPGGPDGWVFVTEVDSASAPEANMYWTVCVCVCVCVCVRR